MRLRTSAGVARLAGFRPRRLAFAALLAACVAPTSGVLAQVAPDYPAGTGLPPPASGAGQAGAAVDAPGPRRGALGWWTQSSVTTQATFTNNANYGEAAERAPDLILQVTPTLNLNREGSRLRVNGFITLDMTGYVDGTQTSRILPQASILSNLEAVENLFFIDGSFSAGQSFINPFLPRPEFSTTENQFTTFQASLSPYLRGSIGQNVNWLIRSDNSFTWTTQTDQPLSNAYYVRNIAEVSRVPTPFGVTLRLTNDLTRIQNQVQPDQTLNTALAIFDYAFTPQFTFGLRGGYENTTYTAEETAGPVYGANLAWKPSPLTSVIGYWEQRFYGPSYQFQASHRQRRLASSASFYRTISTYPQVLLQIPPTGSVSALLDAILVARFPDPLERAQAAEELKARQGLPESLPAGTYIYNQSANILTGGNVNWALIGVRNTLALNLYYLKTELLPDARVPTSFLIFNNTIQQGGGITLTHTLTPVTSLNGTLSSLYTRGFGPSEGQNTRENTASLQANWQLSPRSTAFVGTRFQYSNSDGGALAGSESSEFSVFVGLVHRL